jgi:hypothetical protein
MNIILTLDVGESQVTNQADFLDVDKDQGYIASMVIAQCPR